MTDAISRRGLLNRSYRAATALGISTIAGELASAGNGTAEGLNAEASSIVSIDSTLQLYYKDDWLGAPWLNPEPALLIHGAGESSAAWFGWVPRMGQEFRLLRPDLPGFGRSTLPQDFEWSLTNIAAVLAHFLDRLNIDSIHVIGAKVGGAIASQFAANYPRRTRTLVLASAAFAPPVYRSTSAKVLAGY